jgi:two-component system, OmpR family, alkaline phosphatase synthesis response regulator PhoP
VLRLAIIAKEKEKARVDKLVSELAQAGFQCSLSTEREKLAGVTEYAPDMVLVVQNGSLAEMQRLAGHLKEQKLPVIGLIPRPSLANLNDGGALDDFVAEPWATDEVVARIRRLLKTDASDQAIRWGDLVIDPEKAEVYLAGAVIPLTYREYELLRFLATNPGRVFTREALLNRVWGYDYYGGDRTVDVHIRRLRGKIEDATHSFIETVRNIGYRFCDDLPSD